MSTRAAVAASHWRRALAPGVVVLLLLTTTACGRGGGEPGPTTTPVTPSPTSSDDGELVGGAGDYPTTVQDYAELTVAAWAAPDLLRLSELATSEVHQELVELPGPPDRNWTFLQCEDADPATEAPARCHFHNTDGDQLRVSIDESRLGGPRAATDAAFEAITFPDEPLAYVEAFVAAWQMGNHARTRALATPAAATALGQVAAPDAAEISYALAGRDGPVRTVEVTITADSRTVLLISVNESLLGQPQAVRTAAVAPA